MQSDNCSLSPGTAAAPLPSLTHGHEGPSATRQPLLAAHSPPGLWCKQALAAAHTGPFDPTLHVQRNYVMRLTQSHQTSCGKARIFPSAWLAFIHGLKCKREAFGRSDRARRPGKPAHQ